MLDASSGKFIAGFGFLYSSSWVLDEDSAQITIWKFTKLCDKQESISVIHGQERINRDEALGKAGCNCKKHNLTSRIKNTSSQINFNASKLFAANMKKWSTVGINQKINQTEFLENPEMFNQNKAWEGKGGWGHGGREQRTASALNEVYLCILQVKKLLYTLYGI